MQYPDYMRSHVSPKKEQIEFDHPQMTAEKKHVEIVDQQEPDISKEFVITAMDASEQEVPRSVEVKKQKTKIMQKLEPSKLQNPTLSWQHRSDQMTLCIDKLDTKAKLGYEKPELDQYATHNSRIYRNLYD